MNPIDKRRAVAHHWRKLQPAQPVDDGPRGSEAMLRHVRMELSADPD